MSTATAAKTDLELLRTDPIAMPDGKPLRIDREKGIIYGAIAAQPGVLATRRATFDGTSIQQIVALGQASERGFKSHFTHPTDAFDGLGSYLGRAKNWRVDNGNAVFDLHLSPTAFKSPQGDLGSYVLEMAANEPDSFGNSLALKWKLEAQRDADGRLLLDSRGDPLPPFARVTYIKSIDVVNEGDAAERFLSATQTDAESSLSAALDQLLEKTQHDAADVRLSVNDFLDRYFISKGIDPMSTQTLQEKAEAEVVAANKTAADAALAKLAADAASSAPPAVAAQARDLVPGELRVFDTSEIERLSAVAENTRVREISALCTSAGMPDQIERLTGLEPKFSVDQAKSVLLDAIIRRAPNTGNDGGANDLNATKDPDAAFKKEYEAHKELHQLNDISVEQYVHSRRIDEGLEVLKVGKPKTAAPAA